MFFTVLLAAGNGLFGHSSVMEEIDHLEDMQLVAVRFNTRLKSKLKGMGSKILCMCLGFGKIIADEYLDAADVVVTKPGGLSTSGDREKCKPMSLMKPMPGGENMNLAFSLNNSLAVHSNQYQPVGQVLFPSCVMISK